MKKYLVTYHAPASAWDRMANMTPEDMQKGMEPWTQWMERCGSALLDAGSPLGGGLRLSKSGSTPSELEASGYSMLQAEDMAGATALLQGHPHLDWAPDCAIEVHELMPMPG